MRYRRLDRSPAPFFVAVIASVVLASSCGAGRAVELARERLFDLSLGRMEDQIDLFQTGSDPYGWQTHLILREGRVYIANGNSSKIMEFSSYGDLVTLYYNENENPVPFGLMVEQNTETAGAEAAIAENAVAEAAISEGGEAAISTDAAPAQNIVTDGTATLIGEADGSEDAASSAPATGDGAAGSETGAETGLETGVSSRRAYSYPFRNIGDFLVDRERNLYVTEELPESRSMMNEDGSAYMNEVVVHLGSEGQFLGYYGREGIGGTPFPPVQRVYLTDNDELVVVTKTNREWIVYWFSPNSQPIYIFRTGVDGLPIPRGDTAVAPEPSMQALFPDMRERSLYLVIDYYNENSDVETDISSGVSFAESRVWRYNLEAASFASNFQVPARTVSRTAGNVLGSEYAGQNYECLGMAGDRYFYFICQDDLSYYQLIILNNSGRLVARKYLLIESPDIVYRSLSLSDEGILTALLGFEDHVGVFWWRSDRFIEARRD